MVLLVLPCKSTIFCLTATADIPSNNSFYAVTILFLLAMIFFCTVWLADPGYLKKSDKADFLSLVEKFDPNMLCPSCEVICTTESRHCYICNKCVERFDHHCQWINNCIGVK